MKPLSQELFARLEKQRADHLYRQLRTVDSAQGARIEMNRREFINFSSNDYLGLANHEAVKEGALQAVRDYGAGSGASRLICGSLKLHHLLEEQLAAFKGVEAALCFSTGYATALGTIPCLMASGDVIVVDKLVHASLLDGARLSGAKLRVFQHNDLGELETILQWADKTVGSEGNILLITESVFSMDGDQAPLRELVALKERYGAWLMVDEAHSAGLFGQRGSGLIEELGLVNQVEIQMGTLGKSLGSAGGYIAGSRTLVDYLINRARSFIFSTAPNPASSGAALAALKLLEKEGAERRQVVWSLAQELRRMVLPLSKESPASLIHPYLVGDEQQALCLSKTFLEAGLMVPAIRYPTVRKGQARLRITVTHGHTIKDIECLRSPLQSFSKDPIQ
ncbi:MAG: 8-amino-7-oxononanoate synthase [Verrucomicrobia bacterium]|nr:8-amino-7-oxononanoate synthase [Verrucomicrobiota bacterium]